MSVAGVCGTSHLVSLVLLLLPDYMLTNAASGLGVAALSDTGAESVDSTESYSSDRGIGQCTERVQMAETGVKGRHG